MEERSRLAISSRPRIPVLHTTRPPDPLKTGGRHRVHKPSKEKKRVRWTVPHLWSTITEVASLPEHRFERSGLHMLKTLRQRNKDFASLSPQVLNRFFIGKPPNRVFTAEILAQAARDNNYEPRSSTRHGVLVSLFQLPITALLLTRLGLCKSLHHTQSPFPRLIGDIKTSLVGLRKAHVPLGLSNIRSIMIAMIESAEPQLFTKIHKDGHRFQCGPEFVRKFLRTELGWSIRRATRPAQKIPENVDEILHRAVLRQAFSIRNFNIPAALRVNTDQTQIVLQQGGNITWNERNAHQVTTHGQDEKRAFTLVVGISASGVLLPFQSVWAGKTHASLPSSTRAPYVEATQLGFEFTFSKKQQNYWATEETMQFYVRNILVPYFARQSSDLSLPLHSPSIWQIDCWSVHISLSFRIWMATTYPWIILDYVPGNCTGLFQPCDVGIQRPLKQAITRSLNAEVIKEVSAQVEQGMEPSSIRLDTTLPTLRNRTVGAIVNAFKVINNQSLVLKV